MPEWWLEALLPALVFGILLLVWILVPAPVGESDFGSRVRDRIFNRR